MHNLKVEKYILFLDLTEDYNPGGSLSECSEELFPRGKGGAKIYRSVCNKNQVFRTSKDCY